MQNVAFLQDIGLSIMLLVTFRAFLLFANILRKLINDSLCISGLQLRAFGKIVVLYRVKWKDSI